MATSPYIYLIRLFGRLPLPVAHGVGALVGWTAGLIPCRVRSTVQANIDRCFPELDARARGRLARASLREAGKALLETGALWGWPTQNILDKVVKVSGSGVLADAMAEGRGVLLAAPHLGAWEMIGLYCASLYPMTSVYRPPRQDDLEAWMRAARQRTGSRLVRADRSGVRAVVSSLSRGELVGILPDQEPKSGEGVFVPFFGSPALTMTLFSSLAGRYQVPVVFAWAQRLPRGRGYHIHITAAPKAIADPDSRRAALALNQGIEACVRRCPSQYQWTYRRFRARPPMEKGSS